jgi:hypothetical protein
LQLSIFATILGDPELPGTVLRLPMNYGPLAHTGELTHEVGANEAGTANDENPQDTRLLQQNCASGTRFVETTWAVVTAISARRRRDNSDRRSFP